MGSWSYDVASDLVRFRRSKIMLCEQVLGKLHDLILQENNRICRYRMARSIQENT
mgnify:CR=1 FL=1